MADQPGQDPKSQEPETVDFASSAVLSATYDPVQQTLNITYASGRTYPYPNVPPDIWQAFKDAPSAGTFVADYIRGRF
jgi:KTSC domain-containing protein